MLDRNDKMYLAKFMEGGHIDRLLDEVKKDIALTIIGTEPKAEDVRQDLYQLTRALDAVKKKLQECANFNFLEGDLNK